jgi:hypothetical protein
MQLSFVQSIVYLFLFVFLSSIFNHDKSYCYYFVSLVVVVVVDSDLAPSMKKLMMFAVVVVAAVVVVVVETEIGVVVEDIVDDI